MNRYEIRCTPEQTKKALELGAPIDEVKYTYPMDGKHIVTIGEPDNAFLAPTTEQMIGYLEEQHSLQFLTGVDDEDKFFFNVYHTEGYIEVRGCNSRQEATLAAIDAALDYLLTHKQQA